MKATSRREETMTEARLLDSAAPDRISVLDHGFVRLVDHMGGDLNVVRAARVSYDAAWRAGADEGSDAKLIRYLWKHKHTTPFEAVTFTFEVKAPIFVLRQWHRHRTWSVNELSARYRELPEEFYAPSPEDIGATSKDNKQARDIALVYQPSSEQQRRDQAASRMIHAACTNSFRGYRALLEKGVPRELARTVLPLAVYSHMFATVNLLNLMKFLTLRLHSHAQFEIRQYAEAMRQLAHSVAPVCMAAFEENEFGNHKTKENGNG
jgi:thymidylate synthase (FAD)